MNLYLLISAKKRSFTYFHIDIISADISIFDDLTIFVMSF